MALTEADRLNRIRRFYREVAVLATDHAHTVTLDGRPAKTAGGATLALPTRALADVVASEWDAQLAHIDMAAMPATRLAFTVIDRAGDAHDGLAREVARYAGTDALCYPAETPRSLAERQAAAWTPWRLWAEQRLDVRFRTADGVLHLAQPAETLARVEAYARELDPFRLSALTYAVALFGSAILALAVEAGALDAEAAFDLSRLEEIFQAEQWGLDAEAVARAEALRAEAAVIGRWFAALA